MFIYDCRHPYLALVMSAGVGGLTKVSKAIIHVFIKHLSKGV